MISGTMSTALAAYSTVFMRFAWRVQPRNYLLFACHATNATAQFGQLTRFIVSHSCANTVDAHLTLFAINRTTITWAARIRKLPCPHHRSSLDKSPTQFTDSPYLPRRTFALRTELSGYFVTATESCRTRPLRCTRLEIRRISRRWH